jgi:hypothetical protein
LVLAQVRLPLLAQELALGLRMFLARLLLFPLQEQVKKNLVQLLLAVMLNFPLHNS